MYKVGFIREVKGLPTTSYRCDHGTQFWPVECKWKMTCNYQEKALKNLCPFPDSPSCCPNPPGWSSDLKSSSILDNEWPWDQKTRMMEQQDRRCKWWSFQRKPGKDVNLENKQLGMGKRKTNDRYIYISGGMLEEKKFLSCHPEPAALMVLKTGFYCISQLTCINHWFL